MKMTVRKANADRKAIDRKLDNMLRDISAKRLLFINYYKKSKPIIGTQTPNEVSEDIKSAWQSLNDLLVRRKKLNDAVMYCFGGMLEPISQDNTNIVKVKAFNGLDRLDGDDEWEYVTIAQAISRKRFFDNQVKLFVKAISEQAKAIASTYESFTSKLEKEWMTQVNAQFGPDSNQTSKQRLEYQESIKFQFETAIIDPLKIQSKIDKINDLVDWYSTEIDSVISKATETTEIEVED